MTAPSRETQEKCSCGTDLSRPAPDACRNIDHRSTDETLGLREASCGCCVTVDAVALVRLVAEAETTDSAANELRELWRTAAERLAAVRGLAEDWIPSGDDTAATCGWAITAVLDDQKLAAVTVKSLGRRCGLDGCADPTCGGDS